MFHHHPDTSRQRVSARALFFRILPAFRYTERQHNRRILKGVASILISDHQVKFRPQTTPSHVSTTDIVSRARISDYQRYEKRH